ncbi:hypothetical protein BDZ91DRAFT_740984 [Kalaharituber pfeilii]|nr:hypothetical protein BDZ91DRAFT_740984 [Kalaharituber pfeilii]
MQSKTAAAAATSSGSAQKLATKHGIALESPYLVGFEYARFDATSEVSEQPSSNPEHDIYRHPLAIGDYCESFSRVFDIYSLGLVLVEIALWRPLRKIVSKVVPELAQSEKKSAKEGGNGSSLGRTKAKKAMAMAMALGGGGNSKGAGGGDPPHVPLSQIMKIRDFLLDPTTEDNVPGNLEFFMGEIYKDVVMRCLRGDFSSEEAAGEQGVGDDEDAECDGDVGLDLSEVEGARVTEGFFVTVVRELERCVL